MQFTKQSFMGIELDILTGHPEHDILFIATQVARAAGLKNPKSTRLSAMKTLEGKGFLQLNSLESKVQDFDTLNPNIGTNRWRDLWMVSESSAYQMLLRGHAPASEPFRKWVTEIVLPSIRKTGSFNVNEAHDETSRQYAGELAALHAEVAGLKAMVQQLLDRPSGSLEVPVVSPYEGTTMVALSDGLVFNKHTYREVGETIGLRR
ncbi:BRO family, N-terminal domain [Halopseudomonas litoralis]|uniref:BRO family, N-terminal domain n=1 Tax=Halopseudomonas litoralis TaxID=797277 RepID=A0A1H1VQ06_9GAMM|nr:BRO family protein [Halopseudomonas litoralis]SDS86580.1 BRO family, N-terminal domain [Halopseudomonas litoralis]